MSNNFIDKVTKYTELGQANALRNYLSKLMSLYNREKDLGAAQVEDSVRMAKLNLSLLQKRINNLDLSNQLK